MATIVGGMQQGLTRKEAAEFSFFLAVPTMAAATGWDVLKLFMNEGSEVVMDNLPMLLLGCVVAFVVAAIAIRGFISYLTKHGFFAFGVYRIIVGLFILVWLYTGHTMALV